MWPHMIPSTSPSTSPVYRRDRIIAWALYDVANSSFTTLIVTFIYSTYFTGYMAPGRDLTSIWTTGVAVTAICVALLSPLLGAIADRSGYRKRFLLVSSAICVTATASLAFITPGQFTTAIVVFVIANIAFEMGAAFYDSFLPDLVPQDKIGRVSGFGWGLGYVGGIAALLLALYGFARIDSPLYPYFAGAFGITGEAGANVRATALLVAVWFAVFTVPFILLVPEPRLSGDPGYGHPIAAGFRRLEASFRQIRKYRQIVRLILARLIYNDGLVVIFAMGAVFASQVYGFTTEETIIFGIVLNISAGIGAIGFGFMDDRIGGRNTILLSLVGLAIAGSLAILGQTRELFWIAAIVVGLLVGPNQSASRSLLGRFVPDDKEAEFYGFFAFSGKATAFLGPMIYGALVTATGTHRAGMVVTVVFFVIGALLLLRVNEREGIAASGRS
jgi:UMF1 family MFS transporter